MHDTICDCDRPLDHFLLLVFNDDPAALQSKLKELGLKKQTWLTTSDPTGDATGEGLTEREGGEGEEDNLEELFAADEPGPAPAVTG